VQKKDAAAVETPLTPPINEEYYDGVQSWVNPEVGRPEADAMTPSPADEVADQKERVWRLKERLRMFKAERIPDAQKDA
jgi:hypothetical protein